MTCAICMLKCVHLKHRKSNQKSGSHNIWPWFLWFIELHGFTVVLRWLTVSRFVFFSARFCTLTISWLFCTVRVVSLANLWSSSSTWQWWHHDWQTHTDGGDALAGLMSVYYPCKKKLKLNFWVWWFTYITSVQKKHCKTNNSSWRGHWWLSCQWQRLSWQALLLVSGGSWAFSSSLSSELVSSLSFFHNALAFEPTTKQSMEVPKHHPAGSYFPNNIWQYLSPTNSWTTYEKPSVTFWLTQSFTGRTDAFSFQVLNHWTFVQLRTPQLTSRVCRCPCWITASNPDQFSGHARPGDAYHWKWRLVEKQTSITKDKKVAILWHYMWWTLVPVY